MNKLNFDFIETRLSSGFFMLYYKPGSDKTAADIVNKTLKEIWIIDNNVFLHFKLTTLIN